MSLLLAASVWDYLKSPSSPLLKNHCSYRVSGDVVDLFVNPLWTKIEVSLEGFKPPAVWTPVLVGRDVITENKNSTGAVVPAHQLQNSDSFFYWTLDLAVALSPNCCWSSSGCCLQCCCCQWQSQLHQQVIFTDLYAPVLGNLLYFNLYWSISQKLPSFLEAQYYIAELSEIKLMKLFCADPNCATGCTKVYQETVFWENQDAPE